MPVGIGFYPNVVIIGSQVYIGGGNARGDQALSQIVKCLVHILQASGSHVT